MTEVTIKVPEEIKDIISGTSETMYMEALKEVARKRISYFQRQFREFKKKSAAYEKKYGKSYKEFSQDVPDTIESHDDWIEWSYIVRVADELSNKIEKISLLIGK